MQLSPEILFGPYHPDTPPINATVATEVINAVPVNGAYGPVFSLDTKTTVTGLNPIAGISSDGDYVAFADGLYFNATLVSATASPTWSFEVWGSNTLVHDGTALTSYQNGQGTVIPGAPNGDVIKGVNNFLFVGGLATAKHYIHWSAFNDITQWTPDRKTQCDLNDMGVEYGDVVAIIGDEPAYILQERSISSATYAGPPTIFNFSRLSDYKGCISKGSAIDTPFGAVFFSQDGPNIITGEGVRQIANGQFEEWFANNFDPSVRVTAGYDWDAKTVFWSWSDKDGVPTGLVYSFKSDGASLLGPGDVGLYLNGTDRSLKGVDSKGRIGKFDGPALKATLVTHEVQLEVQRRSFVCEIWPKVDAPVVMASVGVRKDLTTQDVDYSEPSYALDGKVSCRSSARAHRFKVVVPAGQDWKNAYGVQVGFRPEGRR